MAGMSLACDIPLSVELKTRDVPGHLSSSGVVPWALGPKLGPAGTQRYHCGTDGVGDLQVSICKTWFAWAPGLAQALEQRTSWAVPL